MCVCFRREGGDVTTSNFDMATVSMIDTSVATSNHMQVCPNIVFHFSSFLKQIVLVYTHSVILAIPAI